MERIPDIKLIIAKNLIKYRKENNLTQSQLAAKINYSDKAISKWERGEGIPDINVLKQIADIYNVPIEALLHQETYQEKVHSFTRNKYVILILSILLVWLIAMIAYVVIEIIIPNQLHTYYAFLYAIPVSFIVALVFNCIWGSRIYNMILVSGINWGISVSLVFSLSFLSENMWYLYFISAIFEVLTIFWYMLDTKTNSRPKSQINSSINEDKEIEDNIKKYQEENENKSN
jgi:transcriptional regulator with XRE-family HTH domain